MNYLSTAIATTIVLVCSGCVMQSPQATPPTSLASTPGTTSPGETILLVSLEDGSVVKQTINSGADLCFKLNSSSTTTCLTQGEPVVDPVSHEIVGFKMIEDHIELVASRD